MQKELREAIKRAKTTLLACQEALYGYTEPGYWYYLAMRCQLALHELRKAERGEGHA